MTIFDFIRFLYSLCQARYWKNQNINKNFNYWFRSRTLDKMNVIICRANKFDLFIDLIHFLWHEFLLLKYAGLQILYVICNLQTRCLSFASLAHLQMTKYLNLDVFRFFLICKLSFASRVDRPKLSGCESFEILYTWSLK